LPLEREETERQHVSPSSPDDFYRRQILKLVSQFKIVQDAGQDQEQHIKDLKLRVANLESLVGSKLVKTDGEAVYETLRPSLENFRGKFVAIDMEQRKVVGVGDSFDEAYESAKKESGKDQFYFRRVGKRYLFHM